MGLAGRKVKQRIGADPRNLTWADDASKFGANYLAKFGWDSSKGLGVDGEGRTSHIKVSQKLDMLGIGAAQSKDPNGIAWKQSKDFESLLKRLNENVPAVDDSNNLVEGQANLEVDSGNIDTLKEKDEEIKLKESKEERKKRKREEKELRKAEKKRKREELADEEEEESRKKKKRKADAGETIEQPKRAVPRHRAHRARAIAAKNISSKSAASISEILGIASSSSSSTTPVLTTPSGILTPLDQDIGLEKLTTSTKSLADYFKEKLLSKASSRSAPLSVSAAPETETAEDADFPRRGLGATIDYGDDNAPRGGLGSTRTTAFFSSSTSSLGTSKFASMFTSAADIASKVINKVGSENVDVNDGEDKNKRKTEAIGGDEEALKAAKKKAKEERKRAKAENKEKKKRKGEE